MAGNKFNHQEFQQEIPCKKGEKGYKRYCKLNKNAKEEHDKLVKRAELYNKYESDPEYIEM